MTWGNPPKFIKLNTMKVKPKKITPEMLAKSGSEDGEQMALFCWAADNVDKYPPLKWLFAIPNGGSRHIAEATKLVAMGVRSGVPDIMLPCPIQTEWARQYAGCFIELKVGKNKTSSQQDEWIIYLRDAGYYCAECYGWIEARDTLIKYMELKV